MPETAPPMQLGSITASALQAADQRRADTGDLATWRDSRWAERAEASATALGTLLRIPRDRIEITPDPTRAYGGFIWPLLTATDPDATTHRFLAAYNNPDLLLAVHPCPACLAPVPMTQICTLADLGDLLTGAALAEGTWDPAPEFRGDPGHQPDCGHAHLD
jgi:hypothetical protein